MEQEQNNPQSDNQKPTQEIRQNKRSRRYVWPIIILLILALGLSYWFNRDNFGADPDLSLSPSEVGQLSEDDRQIVLRKQLADLQKQIAALTPESDQGDKFTAYIQLAEVQTALGNHKEAIDALNVIRTERSGNTRVWMTYALVYKNMNDIPQSTGMVRQALNIDPGIADNWLFLFEISKALPREQQEAIYKEALEKTENDPKITAAYQAWQQNNPQ